jgi:hypothetical protein
VRRRTSPAGGHLVPTRAVTSTQTRTIRLVGILLLMYRPLATRWTRRLQAASFSEGWRLGYRHIFTVWIVDQIIRKCERRRVRPCWPLCVILAGGWPIWLNFILLKVKPALAVTSTTSLLWLTGLSVLDALMLFAAWGAWTFAFERSRRIDDMLTDQHDQARIGQWLAVRVSQRRQAIFPTITVASSLYFIYSRHDVLSSAMSMDISLISYLCVAWTFLLGGIDAYWLFTAPAIPRLLYHCRSLRLRWQDPASTPGIVLLADGFGVSALFLLAGAAVIVLLFWLPGFNSVAALKSPLDYFFVLLAILCFRVGLYTYVWIYATVKREKHKVLDSLDTDMPAGSSGFTEVSAIQASLYRTVSSAPSLPFSTGAVVQYTATLLGVITAFIIQQANGIPH